MKKILIFIYLVFCLQCIAQNPNLSGVLNTGRLGGSTTIDWWESAGAGATPSRTTICYTANPSTDTSSTLDAAYLTCPSGQVFYLPTGTYHLSGGLKLV